VSSKGAAGPNSSTACATVIAGGDLHASICKRSLQNWTRKHRSHTYLVYDGNEGTVTESATLRKLRIDTCPHFSVGEIGDPVLVEL
jgi:hypothetical protein